jgi:excisionase family DNA binding protein
MYTLYRVDIDPAQVIFEHTRRNKGITLMPTRTKAERPKGRVNTLDEVAALLRISRGSAYEAAKRKEIPTIRIGRRLLVPSDALERLLSGNIAAHS